MPLSSAIMQAPKRAPLWFYPILLTLIVFNLYTVAGTLKLAPQYLSLDIPFAPTIRIVFATVWILLLSLLMAGLALRQYLAYVWVVPVLTVYGLTNIAGSILFA